MQVIEQAPTLGGIAGQGLGQGLAAGLTQGMQMLINSKMEGMKQAKLAEAYSALGLPAQLATLPEAAQKEYLIDIGKTQRQKTGLEFLQGPEAEGIQGISAQQPQATQIQPQSAQAQRAMPGMEVVEGQEQLSPQGEVATAEEELIAPWNEPRAPGPSERKVMAARGVSPEVGQAYEAAATRSHQREKFAAEREKEDYSRHKTWIEDTEKGAEKAEDYLFSLGTLQDAIQSGEVGKYSRAAWIESLSDKGPLGVLKKALRKPSQQAFISASKSLLGSLKEIFGARPTDYDVFLLTDIFPKVGQSEEANMIALKILEGPAQAHLKKQEIFEALREKNPRASVSQLKAATQKQFRSWQSKYRDGLRNEINTYMISQGAGPVRMKTPSGKFVFVDRSLVKEAFDRGGTWAPRK